jgi:hypothetical protein
MKGLNKTLTITAIVLNAIFLAGLIYGITRYGVHTRDLHDQVGFIFTLIFPAVTLAAFVLTFYKKATILRIIAIIVNILFLIILISAIALKGINLAEFAQLLVLIFGLGLPVLNIVAFVLSFRKPKTTIPA